MLDNKHHSDHFADIADPVIAIMGPTACGKTDLACHLYDQNQGYDIISVDSALIYQDMNIGTAKPTSQELQQYPHALVDIIAPNESYSVASFLTDARALIKQSHLAGNIPILVGGTMMYYKALLSNMDNLPPSDASIRLKLQQQLREDGIASLHARLADIDAMSAQQLKTNDTQRILRALEVYEISGQPISSFHTQKNQTVIVPDTWRLISIMPDRAWLHERIQKRLDIMWQAGFIDEVIALQKKYTLTEDMPAMRAVGYRQVYQYLKIKNPSKGDRQLMKDKALYATRQLAKRQYTWLRKFSDLYNTEVYFNNSLAKKNLI